MDTKTAFELAFTLAKKDFNNKVTLKRTNKKWVVTVEGGDS